MRHGGKQKYNSQAIMNMLGRIEADEIAALVESLTDETTKPSGNAPQIAGTYRLHKIGAVELAKHVFNDHSIAFELIIWRENPGFKINPQAERCFRGKSPTEVLNKARKAYPRPAQEVDGEIIAVRGWRLVGDLLYPLNAGNSQDRDYLSSPVATAHELPTRENASGLYAVKPEHTPHVIDSYQLDVYGVVGMYGRVIEHEYGYRAQHYIIRRLIVRLPVSDGFMKLLAERYDCDVKREVKK